MNEIEQAITAQWGERCPDHDDDCACCRAWATYDVMQGALRQRMGQAERIAGLKEAGRMADKRAREVTSGVASAALSGLVGEISARIAEIERGE